MIILFIEEKGYLAITNQPWITGLYVLPERRKEGIATALINHVMKKAKAFGHPELHLDTAKMKDFYLRKNWEVVGEAFWKEGGRNVTVMKKTL